MARCEHCGCEQDDFEIYGDAWACDRCKKYNDLPDGYCSYIVVPPEATKEQLSIFMVDNSKRGNTKEEAWEKFLGVSLKKEGYKNDGFKAVKVDIALSNILYEIECKKLGVDTSGNLRL